MLPDIWVAIMTQQGSLEVWMNAKQLWQAALGQLQMEMPRATFETWVRDAELLAYEDRAFVIGVQNAYARDWLEDRLLSTVKRVLTGIVGQTVEVRFVVWQDSTDIEPPVVALLESSPCENRGKLTYNLNNRYTFEDFVVGSSNR
ncbi:MAG: hypothetical protein E3J37_07725, partial [Anaerolineales bacterium]